MGRHRLHLAFVAVLGLGVGVTVGACSDDWESPRCTAYENIRSVCASGCPQMADCSLLDTLATKSASELDLTEFDACIECLDAEATAGTCRDCELEASGESCRDKLADWLDLDCL